jgi:hypothetical protein
MQRKVWHFHIPRHLPFVRQGANAQSATAGRSLPVTLSGPRRLPSIRKKFEYRSGRQVHFAL